MAAPVLKLQTGSLKVAVWENEFTYQGKTKKAHSASIQHSYQDKDGNWKESASIPARLLPNLCALLEEVYRTTEIRDVTKGNKSTETESEEPRPF